MGHCRREEKSMIQDGDQGFRLEIFKLQRDQLSVTIYPLDAEGTDPYASSFSGEVLTKILKEHFGLDDHRLCELGMELASQGRVALTLHCTPTELRAAQLIAS
jgi:hypothetical protein